MGKHFDTLVEVVRHHLGEESLQLSDFKEYLSMHIQNASLIEFPFSSFDIRKLTKKELEEYDTYINDYLKLSRGYDTPLILPFKITAIEDKESVVFLEKQKHSQDFTVTACANLDPIYNTKKIDNLFLLYANITLADEINQGAMKMNVNPLSYIKVIGGKTIDLSDATKNKLLHAISFDIANAVMSYLGELVYIMDPSIFILKRESNASIKNRKRAERKNKNAELVQKTSMRPHFIFIGERELREFIKDNSKEPYPAHPVAGHWRHLVSERYKAMRGQRIFIGQYFTGDGRFEGVNGWNYEIYIKETPTKIVPYGQSKNYSKKCLKKQFV